MLEQIQESHKNSVNDSQYLNYDIFKKLFYGRANEAFAEAVHKKIKLKYGNRVFNANTDGTYSIYNQFDQNGKLSLTGIDSQAINDLIGNIDYHQKRTDKVIEFALNEEYECSNAIDNEEQEIEDTEHLIDSMIDITETLKQAIATVDWSGSCLIKPVYDINTKDFSIDILTNHNYFPIFSRTNKRVKVAYIEYMEYKKVENDVVIYLVTIHSRGYNTVYFADKTLKPIESLELFREIGLEAITPDVWNQFTHRYNFEGINENKFDVCECFQKQLIGEVYPVSSYFNASLEATRDYIVTDTTESQTLQELLEPKIKASEEYLSWDEVTQKNVLNMKNNVFMAKGLSMGTNPVLEQIPIDLKTEQIDLIKEHKKTMIMSSLGLNKSLLGLAETGGLSGTAKTLDMQSILASTSVIRKNVSNALEYVLDFMYYALYNQELVFKIEWGNLLSMTDDEKLNIALKENTLGISKDYIVSTYLGVEESEVSKYIQPVDIVEPPVV